MWGVPATPNLEPTVRFHPFTGHLNVHRPPALRPRALEHLCIIKCNRGCKLVWRLYQEKTRRCRGSDKNDAVAVAAVIRERNV
jgi:hypothetical protein